MNPGWGQWQGKRGKPGNRLLTTENKLKVDGGEVGRVK